MGLLAKLFGARDRDGEDEHEGIGPQSLPVPEWVPRDVEEGFVKVRLFLSPAGSVPSLYELSLPEEPASEGGLLRCFSPPPESSGSSAGTPGRAWTAEVGPEEMRELVGLAGGISVFPAGSPSPAEDAATVELSLAAGQAEARIRWWLNPPSGWTAVDRFVARLRALAERGAGR